MTSYIEYNHILLNNFWVLTKQKQPFLHKLYTIPTSICKQHPNFRSTFIALATLVIYQNCPTDTVNWNKQKRPQTSIY